jgi:hypothetical protein
VERNDPDVHAPVQQRTSLSSHARVPGLMALPDQDCQASPQCTHPRSRSSSCFKDLRSSQSIHQNRIDDARRTTASRSSRR